MLLVLRSFPEVIPFAWKYSRFFRNYVFGLEVHEEVCMGSLFNVNGENGDSKIAGNKEQEYINSTRSIIRRDIREIAHYSKAHRSVY